ncbi:hypothetical protein GMES_4353 [Paraglaciecola mesophila KMM 241]|uniref:Uncharacterized protein n=1 Tax=Paraglaciecola mesophila KMM 241 TaxID=1128912 RepID=K6Y1A4_9ALTE|nr:hypothetical protein GMES_4353 [Paraglaciecola mesophila KMM 241]
MELLQRFQYNNRLAILRYSSQGRTKNKGVIQFAGLFH